MDRDGEGLSSQLLNDIAENETTTMSSNALLAFTALLLVAFICMKSSLSILLERCGAGGDYPFVIQTVTLVAFLCQMVFYTLQTTKELGFKGGLGALVGSHKQMGPAIFYSTLVALSTLLQSMSQSFIEASLYIILMQMTMVLVALGDRFILKKETKRSLWVILLMQAGIVIGYTLVSREKDADAASMTASTEAADGPQRGDGSQMSSGVRQAIGVGLCMLAECCSACGSILQQKFMQVAAPDLLTSIKLCYQHLFGALVMIATSLLMPSNVAKVWNEGFFVGWSALTVVTALCMWLYFLVASSVTAYISALAGAMGASVVIGVVALYEVVFAGKFLWPSQIVLMGCLFGNSFLYTYLKDKHNKELIEADTLSNELRFTIAASSISNKAQVNLIRTYTPASERRSLSKMRWNSSNPALADLVDELGDAPPAKLFKVSSWHTLFLETDDGARDRADSEPNSAMGRRCESDPSMANGLGANRNRARTQMERAKPGLNSGLLPRLESGREWLEDAPSSMDLGQYVIQTPK